MDSRPRGFRRRLLVLLLVTAGGLAIVWGRMFQLQVVSGEAARQRAEAATRLKESVLGPRGRILDATGRPLALDRTIVQLVFSPAEWATRERFRCRRCGATLFARTPRYFDRDGRAVVAPKGCSCGAKRVELEAVPAEDLEPLETALHLPPGTLAAEAEDRMDDLARRIAVATTDRVLGLSPGVRARARALEAERGRRPGASKERATAAAVDEVLATLAPELADHAFEVEDVRFEERTDRYGRPIVLAGFDGAGGTKILLKRLPAEAERLLELDRAGRFRGFRAEAARERWYPRHGLLAQTIGITGSFASREELESFRARFGADTILPETRVGRLGLEARYDDELRGQPGLVVREKDDGGAFTRIRVERAPVRGKDLKLWSDADANAQAHRLLAEAATDEGFAGEGPASAAFVLLDAETGHLLACAETPVYDLNGSLREITKRVDDGDGGTRDVVPSDAASDPAADPNYFTPAEPDPNVALSRVFRIAIEPGSSIKPLTALTLLHSGHALPRDYRCAGHRRGVNDFPKCHDDHPEPLDVVGMLRDSCNRFCADGASDRTHFALHRDLFPAWAHACGFERACGVDFPAAGTGRYPKALSTSSIRQVAIGQSMTATPLQMARLAALVANGRRLPFPRIVATVGDEPVRDGGVDVDLEPGALAKVREGMRECAESGTAKDRFVGKPGLEGVTVYGKTGTAIATGSDWVDEDVARAERERQLAADPHSRTLLPYHLWFVGYATKASTPTVAFACVLHARKAGAGGDAAAPVVQRFLSWWYAR